MPGRPWAKYQPEQVHADIDTYINKFDRYKTLRALFESQPGKRQFGQAIKSEDECEPADVFRVLRIFQQIGHRLATLQTFVFQAQVSAHLAQDLDDAGAGRVDAHLRQLLVQKPGDFARVLKIAMNQPPFIPGSLLQSQEQLMISHSADTARVINRMIETYGYYTPDSFATAVRAIEAPTLVIWGEKDAIIDAGVVPELTANLKNEEPPVILQGIGHTPILEAEQLVVQHYLPFLRKAQATPNKFAPRPAAAQP